VKIYRIEPTPSILETQKEFERVWQEGIELGKWTVDSYLDLKITYVDPIRLNTLIEGLTEGKDRNLNFYPYSLNKCLEHPILYHADLEVLEAKGSEFPTNYYHLMSARMRDVILASGIRGTSYPVAVFETSLLEQVFE
jgi:hypothetical protein